MTDLRARLLQECHRREDLEVKVLALETEHRQMEAVSESLAEQVSRSTDQQKGMIVELALLMQSAVRHLAVLWSAGDGAQPFLRGHHATDYEEGGGRGESRAGR